YQFDPKADLIFDRKHPLPGHANGMQFFAFDAEGRLLLRRVYYSIGGGFVVSEEELQGLKNSEARFEDVPFPFGSAREMLEMAASSGLSIAEMKRRNELVCGSAEELDARLDLIWLTMKSCIERGLSQEGELP